MLILLAFSFLAGIFTALSPCILPVLPALLAGGVGRGKLRPLGMVLGLVCSFSFFTLMLTWLVHETGISPKILRDAAIILIFSFGVVMIFPSLSNWFAKMTTPFASLGTKVQGHKVSQGFLGGLIFGCALGLIWTPCAGPILAAITTLVATKGLSVTAVFMTLAYSLGAAIPMFIFAYGSGKLIQSSRFLSRYTESIRQSFGFLMIIFAVALFFNQDVLLNEKLSQVLPDFFLEKNLPIKKELKTLVPGEDLNEGKKAPEITGIVGWVNSSPLKIVDLKGKVVLIDFWTYSCINCLRTLPSLKKWYADYKKEGLVIIGVHTPEFEFEKEMKNIEMAVKRLGIDYPVAVDSNYETWNAFHNHYWPAHYLIDQQGIVRMIHYGEGGYIETENEIRKLLRLKSIENEKENKIARPISPETYLGFARGHGYTVPLISGEKKYYGYEGSLGENQIGLRGFWSAEEEYILSEGDASYLDSNFLATRVYLVLGGASKMPIEVILDGKVYGHIEVDGDRKYDVVTTSYERHQLSLKIPKGIKAYAFTFGDE